MSTRIAFASTDGFEVDQHFGRARIFQIYETDGWKPEKRTLCAREAAKAALITCFRRFRTAPRSLC